MTRDCIINKSSRMGNKSFPYVMDEKSVNIDNKFDLLIAKTLIENDTAIMFKEAKIFC